MEIVGVSWGAAGKLAFMGAAAYAGVLGLQAAIAAAAEYGPQLLGRVEAAAGSEGGDDTRWG